MPPQPANVDPGLALAWSVTRSPMGKLAVQVPGQLIPARLLETSPMPFPASVTVIGTVGITSKVTVTD
jgi:hypothetical protein